MRHSLMAAITLAFATPVAAVTIVDNSGTYGADGFQTLAVTSVSASSRGDYNIYDIAVSFSDPKPVVSFTLSGTFRVTEFNRFTGAFISSYGGYPLGSSMIGPMTETANGYFARLILPQGGVFGNIRYETDASGELRVLLNQPRVPGTFRVTINQFTTVPEPTTWAMMIGGFMLMGGAVRIRRDSQTIVTS